MRARREIYFWCQTLEEGCRAFMLDELFYDSNTMHLPFEICILYTCLYGVKRSSDRDGSHCPCYWCNKILRPGSFRIVRYTEDIFFGNRRSTEELRKEVRWMYKEKGMRLTAKLPGALRAIVHPQPRYSVVPSSIKIRITPLPRNASGFTCRLIFRASKGRST